LFFGECERIPKRLVGDLDFDVVFELELELGPAIE
jgi:hypothetical protein